MLPKRIARPPEFTAYIIIGGELFGTGDTIKFVSVAPNVQSHTIGAVCRMNVLTGYVIIEHLRCVANSGNGGKAGKR
jgi:hypothetical protein